MYICFTDICIQPTKHDMRTLILIYIFLSSFYLSAQDTVRCSKYLTQDYDSLTEESYYSTEIIVPGKEKDIGFGIMLYGGSLHNIVTCDIVCVSKSMICMNPRNTISISFTDGSKLDIKCNGDFNCEGNSELHFGGYYGNLTNFKILKTLYIKSISVETSIGWIQHSISLEQAKQLRYSFVCLSDLVVKPDN